MLRQLAEISSNEDDEAEVEVSLVRAFLLLSRFEDLRGMGIGREMAEVGETESEAVSGGSTGWAG